MNIKCKKLTETAIIPTRATSGSAGYDMYSDETITIKPGETKFVSTGIAFGEDDHDFIKDCYITGNYVILMYPRSGLACKYGINLANGVGVIDKDYRGEVKAALHNNSQSEYTVNKGDRITQCIFQPYIIPELVESNDINNTDRNTSGFGSTGK